MNNRCKLTECAGKPRCNTCAAMDAFYGTGDLWRPADRVIPLTMPGTLWSQREYVACAQLGIEFAAHRHGDLREAFHYAFPEGIGCTTVVVGFNRAERYLDHDFCKSPDWIEKCRAATAKATGGAS